MRSDRFRSDKFFVVTHFPSDTFSKWQIFSNHLFSRRTFFELTYFWSNTFIEETFFARFRVDLFWNDAFIDLTYFDNNRLRGDCFSKSSFIKVIDFEMAHFAKWAFVELTFYRSDPVREMSFRSAPSSEVTVTFSYWQEVLKIKFGSKITQ